MDNNNPLEPNYDEQEQRIKKKILDDLEETYHGEERRRNQGPRIISTIDRWGPGVISVLTFIAFIGYAWITDQRIARLEGIVESRSHMEVAMRSEIQTWQAYVVTLQKRLIEHGIDVPDSPKPVK